MRFPGQLTVITGETGAGKSIFLEALGLALGRRAEAMPDSEGKCVVEVDFSVKKQGLAGLLEGYGLDDDDQLTLRREIAAGGGRSRCLINDSVVPLSVLRDVASHLVDIHSQHETFFINEGRFQLGMLDAFAGNEDLLEKYRVGFRKLSSLRKEAAELAERELNARKEQDYLNFLFAELQEAGLEKGKLAALEEEGRVLENLETIRAALAGSAAVMGGGESNVLTALVQAKHQLTQAAKYGKQYEDLLSRVTSAYIELKDLYGETEQAALSLELDEQRLDTVNAALDRTGRLLKKHGVSTEEELLTVRDDLEKRLLDFGSLEQRISALAKEIADREKHCRQLAGELGERRKRAVPSIEKQVRKMLADLSMPAATFSIMITSGKMGESGADEVSFMFSANKGSVQQELHRVASGGELSRLMLCLKSLLAEKKELPAIIFDEIDTGVSGEVAARIGDILHRMSAHMQVITITHLPQMASRGSHHLFVYKQEEGKRTISRIRALDAQERVQEIAKMLSAGEPGNSALENARELLRA